MRPGRFQLAAPAGLAFVLMAAAPAQGDEVADFYSGKTMTVVVPVTPGGSFHLYAQIVQRHLGKYIPGHPALILQNRPGAGGITANAYMANAAPRDGTVLAEINPGSVTTPIMRPARYDPRKFEWLGSVAVRGYVGAVWHTVEADTIEKMKKTEVIIGSTGTGSQNYQIPALINHVLGTKLKIVTGYKGGGDVNLAIERGEVHGRCNFYEGFVGAKPDWIRDKKLKFFFAIGPAVPELPDVPRLKNLVKKEEDRQMLNLIESTLEIGQAFYMPPETPKARVAAVAAGFDKMVKDKEFLAEAEKHQLMIEPRTAAQVRKEIEEAFKAPPAVGQKLAKILGIDREDGGGKAKKKKQ